MRGCSKAMAVAASWVWLLNPLPITVSSRGNAESIMAALVLSTIYFLCTRRTSLAALMFGISVHFKIYPLIYSLPFYFVLSKNSEASDKRTEKKQTKKEGSSVSSQLSGGYLSFIVNLLWPTVSRLKFVILSVLTFGVLTYSCYMM